MKESARRRLDKALQAINAARRDLQAGDYNLAVSRAYYAMFYTAEALLLGRGRRFRKHGAVHGAYAKEYARRGPLDPRYHRWLLDAFEARMLADYADATEFSKKRVEELIKRAEEFLSAARGHLEAHP